MVNRSEGRVQLVLFLLIYIIILQAVFLIVIIKNSFNNLVVEIPKISSNLYYKSKVNQDIDSLMSSIKDYLHYYN